MSDIYDIYKPFRNYLKQFSLIDSLAVIRSYMQFLQFGQSLTKDIEIYPSFLNDYKTYLHEWEIEVLAKEIILNSDNNFNPKTLKKWQNFSKAINALKDLENAICGRIEQLHALDINTGEILWIKSCHPNSYSPAQSQSLITVDSIGNIYFAQGSGIIGYNPSNILEDMYDKSDRILWIDGIGQYLTSPIVIENETIYVPGARGLIRAQGLPF